MEEIVLSRSPFMVVVALVSTLFVLCLGTIAAHGFYEEIDVGLLRVKTFWLLGWSILSCVLAIAGLKAYRKNMLRVTANDSTLQIGKQIHTWDDVQDVFLEGKKPFKFIMTYPMEGLTIVFKDGSKRYLFDDMYTNIWELKFFISNRILTGSSSIEIADHHLPKYDPEDSFFDVYNGYQLLCFHGVLFWATIAFLLFILVKGIFVWIFFYVIAMFLALSTWMLHYFEVSGDTLIVRNQILFWKSKAYHFKDVKTVVFEQSGRAPNSMRIITENFRTKLYPANPLSDKTWLALKAKLETHGVQVRNECIYEPVS